MQHARISRFPAIPEHRKKLIADTLVSWSGRATMRPVEAKGSGSIAEMAQRCSGAEGRRMTAREALEAHLDPASGHSDFLDILQRFCAQLVLKAYHARRPHAGLVATRSAEHFGNDVEVLREKRERIITMDELAGDDLYGIAHRISMLGTMMASIETGAVFGLLERSPLLTDGQYAFSIGRNNDHLFPGNLNGAALSDYRDRLLGIDLDEAIGDTLAQLSGRQHQPLRRRPENRVVAVIPSGQRPDDLSADLEVLENPLRGVQPFYLMRAAEGFMPIELSFEKRQSGPRIDIGRHQLGLNVAAHLAVGTRITGPEGMCRLRMAA
mgnify:CR=1 FL=1